MPAWCAISTAVVASVRDLVLYVAVQTLHSTNCMLFLQVIIEQYYLRSTPHPLYAALLSPPVSLLMCLL